MSSDLPASPDVNRPESEAGSTLHRLLGRLKLRQLQLVMAVEETGNLHRAAIRLGLSQPNATRLLQDAEHALGAKLFERSSMGMTPTPSGTLTVRQARLLLSEVNRLQQDLEGLKGGLSGTVRIGAIPAAIPEIVAPALVEATRTHRGIRVAVVTDTSDNLLEKLWAGRIDCMIGRPLGALEQTSLHFESLGSEALQVVCDPRHPIAQRAELTLSDLAAEPWILQSEPSPMRRAVEKAFLRENIELPFHPLEASSFLVTISLLRHGEFLAVLPRSVSRLHATTGTIIELPVTLPDLLGPFGLISVPGRLVTPAAAQVRERLLAASRHDQET